MSERTALRWTILPRKRLFSLETRHTERQGWWRHGWFNTYQCSWWREEVGARRLPCSSSPSHCNQRTRAPSHMWSGRARYRDLPTPPRQTLFFSFNLLTSPPPLILINSNYSRLTFSNYILNGRKIALQLIWIFLKWLHVDAFQPDEKMMKSWCFWHHGYLSYHCVLRSRKCLSTKSRCSMFKA